MPPPDDFRQNLIIDQNNPILVQKAWRDHHTDGWAYLAAPYGEDALTWNVFRSLDKQGPRAVLQQFFGLDGPVEEILFWGCDPDGASEAQQLLSICLRKLDGRRGGTMTEPDLVLITPAEVCFVECKVLCTPEPWGGKTPRAVVNNPAEEEGAPEENAPAELAGWQKRWADYRDAGFAASLPADPSADTDRPVYQLVRNAIYAKQLAEALGNGRRPRVLSLVSKAHAELYPGITAQYHRFRELCGAFAEVEDIRYWEDLRIHVPDRLQQRIATALETVEGQVAECVLKHIGQLRSAKEARANRAAAELRRLGHQRVRPHLGELLRGFRLGTLAVAHEVVRECCQREGASAIPILVRAVGDSNDAICIGAIGLLGDIGPAASGALPTLQGCLTHKTARIRAAATEAIGKITNSPPSV